jgi:hypothetical protein
MEGEYMKKWFLVLFGLLFVSSCSTVQITKTNPSLPNVQITSAKGGIQSVTLTWIPITNQNVKGYVIYRSGSPTGKFDFLTQINNNLQSSYTDTGGILSTLENDTTYYYRIAAFNDEGVGPFSQVSATTLPRPNPPEGLKVISGLPHSLILQWNPSNDMSVSGYMIYRAESSLGPFKAIKRLNGRENTTYTDTELKDGTTYYYEVASINYKGVESAPSAYVSGITQNKPVPPLSLKAVPTGAGTMTVYWFPSPTKNVAYYEVYYGNSPSSMAYLGKVNSSVLEYTVKNLEPGKIYLFMVRSVDTAGIKSPDSEIVQGKTFPIPQAPKGIKVEQLSNGAVRIEWASSGSDIAYYELFRRYYLFITNEIAKVQGTLYTDDKVKPDTTYYYWVKAVDKWGQVSPDSETVSIKTRNQ